MNVGMKATIVQSVKKHLRDVYMCYAYETFIKQKLIYVLYVFICVIYVFQCVRLLNKDHEHCLIFVQH